MKSDGQKFVEFAFTTALQLLSYDVRLTFFLKLKPSLAEKKIPYTVFMSSSSGRLGLHIGTEYFSITF